MSIAMALLVGLALGALSVWLAVRAALADRRRLAVEAHEREVHLAEVTTRLETVESGLDERMTSAIKEISAQALRDNSAAFTEQAMGRLDQYVKPLKESLAKVDTSVQTLEQRRERAYGELHKELDLLRQSSEGLRTQAGNLTVALRGNPQVRGQWGEIQLRRVIEVAGMLPYCDFTEQRSITDDEGRLLRPDVIVRLPGGKSIVIDAKVSLVAYLDAHRDDLSDAEKLLRLDAHAEHVKKHVQQLSQKAYWRELPDTPEFVVMFLHNETSWTAALDRDPGLQELAFANNVIPATPTNLIGLLRAVHYGWQQETIAESAREISDLGRELYKRLSRMGVNIAKVGKTLGRAVEAYNETVGTLERQVLPQARKFEKHGISGIEAPELEPIETKARALVAPELVGESGETEQAQLEVVA
jgi:DNA recombination protein RmuC